MRFHTLISAVQTDPQEFYAQDRSDLESLIDILNNTNTTPDLENAVANWLMAHPRIDDYLLENKSRLSAHLKAPTTPLTIVALSSMR